MQDMTFSCHLVFQHSAVVQSQNNSGVYHFWHPSLFLFHLTLSHSASGYEVCSPLFIGNDRYIHILWQFCYHPCTLLWLLGRLCYHHLNKMRYSKVHVLLNISFKHFCSISSLRSSWRSCVVQITFVRQLPYFK